MLLSWFFLACLGCVFALNVTSPSANQVVDFSKEFSIKWTAEGTDPRMMSINLVNVTAVDNSASINVVPSCNTSLGEYKVHWRDSLQPISGSFQLLFWDHDSNNFVGQSQTFKLTPSPDTVSPETESKDNVPTPPDSHQISARNDTISEAVIPSIFGIVFVCCGVTLCVRKRRTHIKIKKPMNDPAAVELVGSQERESSVSFNADLESGEYFVASKDIPISPPTKAAQPPHECPTDDLDDEAHLLAKPLHRDRGGSTWDREPGPMSREDTEGSDSDIALLKPSERQPTRFISLYGKSQNKTRRG